MNQMIKIHTKLQNRKKYLYVTAVACDQKRNSHWLTIFFAVRWERE